MKRSAAFILLSTFLVVMLTSCKAEEKKLKAAPHPCVECSDHGRLKDDLDSLLKSAEQLNERTKNLNGPLSQLEECDCVKP